MNFCELIPFLVAIIYYFIPKNLSTPKKLTIISWLTLALVMLVPCRDAFAFVTNYIKDIAIAVEKLPPYLSVLKISAHNLLVLVLCALIGKVYLGFTIALTAIVTREIAEAYPINVLLGAHTILELYAYSLATSRRKRELVESIIYLFLAAVFEVIAIRF